MGRAAPVHGGQGEGGPVPGAHHAAAAQEELPLPRDAEDAQRGSRGAHCLALPCCGMDFCF